MRKSSAKSSEVLSLDDLYDGTFTLLVNKGGFLHGVAPDKLTDSTTLPIYQTAAYSQATAEDMEKIFAGRKAGFAYTRISNSTTANFERRLADLERGAGAVAFSSGMAAIAAAILNVVDELSRSTSRQNVGGLWRLSRAD